jgi:hypothetical protein
MEIVCARRDTAHLPDFDSRKFVQEGVMKTYKARTLLRVVAVLTFAGTGGNLALAQKCSVTWTGDAGDGAMFQLSLTPRRSKAVVSRSIFLRGLPGSAGGAGPHRSHR